MTKMQQWERQVEEKTTNRIIENMMRILGVSREDAEKIASGSASIVSPMNPQGK